MDSRYDYAKVTQSKDPLAPLRTGFGFLILDYTQGKIQKFIQSYPSFEGKEWD